jgi:hypothetical protein
VLSFQTEATQQHKEPTMASKSQSNPTLTGAKTYGLLFILLIAALPLAAQSPAAPLPAQLATAKAVFVVNAGSSQADNELAIAAYNSVYQALTTGSRFHPVLSPSDADLIFEVSEIDTNESQTSFNSYIKLVIRDAKSQSILWTTYGDVESADRITTLEKKLTGNGQKLLADLNFLITNKVPPVTTPKKTRISDEGKWR